MTFPDQHTSKAVVINLDRRRDRWRDMIAGLGAAGIDRFERFAAIDGATIDPNDRRLVSRRVAREIDQRPADHRWPSRGGLGCFVSHLAVWKQFDDHPGLESLWVFEDDARPAPYLLKLTPRERLRQLAAVPARADLILLGRDILADSGGAFAHGLIRRIYCFFGTQAYIIKRRAAKKLLKPLLPIQANIDMQIGELLMREPSFLAAYGFLPEWFGCDNSSPSDIDHDIDGAKADARLNRYLARTRLRLWRAHRLRLRVHALGE